MAGEYPNHWSYTSLRHCGKWYSGGTPNTALPEYWDGDIPWITASSLHDFYIRHSERRVTDLGLKNGTRLMPENTILFVVRGMSLKTEFRVGIAKRPVAFGQDCKALVVRPDIDPLFLANVLRSKAQEILGIADEASHGTGRLQTAALEQLIIPLPPLPTQRAIAHILGTLDDKIELNRRMNRTLEAIARAIFKSWFVDFLPVRANMARTQTGDPVHRNAARKRSPLPLGDGGRRPGEGGMEALDRLFPDSFEDSQLGKIPKGWEARPLGEVCDFAYGRALKASHRRPGNVAVMGSNGQVGWHDTALEKGPGLVIGRKGNPGVVTWVHRDFFPIDTTFFVVPGTTTMPLTYLNEAIALLDLPRLSADSAVPGLNRNMAYMSRILVPSPDVLSIFDKHTMTLADRIFEADEQNRTLSDLRDALLPRLLSGELPIWDAERISTRVV